MNAMTISDWVGREQRSIRNICGYLLPPCGMRIKSPSFAFFVVISDFRFPLFQATPLFPPACRAGSSRHLVRRSFSEDGSFSDGGSQAKADHPSIARSYAKLREVTFNRNPRSLYPCALAFKSLQNRVENLINFNRIYGFFGGMHEPHAQKKPLFIFSAFFAVISSFRLCLSSLQCFNFISMSDSTGLNKEIKQMLVDNLMLKIGPDEIGDDQPLFGPDSLGLDSVDALQIVVALDKNYGLKLTDADTTRKILHNVNTIAAAVTKAKQP
jgi:acyl carrier protein